jgi:glycosyltransferase involved in cell wall biosynthesis
MNLSKNKKLRLLIISHVIHYSWQGKIWAYGPYLKEIEIWADLFPEVVIASPLREEKPPGDNLFFTKKNIYMAPQIERGGDSLLDKFWQIISLPVMVIKLLKVLLKADVIHVRCPGNLGLLGVILSPLISRKRIAKYAGQWNGYKGESIANKLQRSILKSKWWNSPVTVYGDWPKQPKHVIPFFTSILTDDLIEKSKVSSQEKNLHDPLRILFVGRLSKSKNVGSLIKAVHTLIGKGINIDCKIIGQGDQLETLLSLVYDLELTPVIKFLGGLKFEEVINFYEWADILVLVSETEGWPKAITEAMAFGVVCIGSNRGLVPQILGEGRGIVIEPGDYSQLANEINKLSAAPGAYKLISRSAAEWSQKYSISSLKNELKEVMKREWKIDFS